MLDNESAGATRIRNTGYETFAQMGLAAGSQYLAKLGTTEAIQMLEGRSAVDPNVIGSNSFYAMYFEKEQKWVNVSAGGGHLSLREETNAGRIAELDDARAVRLERQQKATQFHEDDPYRSITRSPFTASADGLPDPTQAPTKLTDIGPDHRDYALLQQVRAGVSAIDAQAGRTPDESSERLIASVMTLARQNNLDRADHVVLSEQTADSPTGRHVFVVQGELNNPRTCAPTCRPMWLCRRRWRSRCSSWRWPVPTASRRWRRASSRRRTGSARVRRCAWDKAGSAAKKSPARPGCFLCCDGRNAQRLRAFNHALICGSEAARSFTRVWIVLMALSAACREVGAMYCSA